MLHEIMACSQEDVQNLIKIDFDNYVRQLDEFKKRIQVEKNIREEQSIYLKNLNDSIVRKAEKACLFIKDRKTQKSLRSYFRGLRPEIYYSSEIMRKGFKKERGYPGDFEMMVFCYDKRILSPTLIGQYFDSYFVNNAYAEAVRGRKDKMVEILNEYIKNFKGKEISILNLPCGPARDIKELVETSEIRDDISIKIVCVDQDLEALAYAEKSIINLHKKITIEFKQGNILSYVKNPMKYKEELGEFDLVYSIGLADYLTDKLLKNMILFSFNLTKSKGEIVYAFKIHDKAPFAPIPPKWFCDWEFVPRNLINAEELVFTSGINNYIRKETVFENSGLIAFISAGQK